MLGSEVRNLLRACGPTPPSAPGGSSARSASSCRSLASRFFKNKFSLFLVVFLVSSSARFGHCAEVVREKKSETKQTAVFYLENDIFAGTDEYYTNAIKLTWVSRDLEEYVDAAILPGWCLKAVEKIPLLNRPGEERNIGFSLGQNIYTPNDIEATELLINQRPYAGWTYLSVALHSKTFRRLRTMEVSLGIVGPSSLAEQSQKTIHKMIDTKDPKGWDHQLGDEPGLLISVEETQRLLERRLLGLDWDLIPHIGGGLGNVATYVSLGFITRIGYRIPLDYGTSLIRPGGAATVPAAGTKHESGKRKKYGFYVFAGAEGRGIAQNIFLDGNTFGDSQSVDKEPFVADLKAGASVIWKAFELTYTQVYRTREFERQDEPQVFGSISLSMTF